MMIDIRWLVVIEGALGSDWVMFVWFSWSHWPGRFQPLPFKSEKHHCGLFAGFLQCFTTIRYVWSSRSYCWNIARKLFQRMSQKTIASKSFTITSYSICRTKSEDTKHCSLHLSIFPVWLYLLMMIFFFKTW